MITNENDGYMRALTLISLNPIHCYNLLLPLIMPPTHCPYCPQLPGMGSNTFSI